ncbi:phosphopantetheine-binding protein [Methylobacterium sp. R2-1]|uniref:phosphopantetheine-binding protein n=1 Tax=Methylobacterium sp. R2-1 TaxID=2587064 RepID=UPI00160EDBBA|nr:phosphopantetheine-binding protein [Methylobacterium sp. R2-1]MBB2959893.1 acyl carrier protein [Methylobacterium sp. R2-1]
MSAQHTQSAAASVEEQVRTIIAAVFGVETERVSDDAYLGVDLGADALDQVELECELEDAFSIFFEEGEFEFGRQTRVRDIAAQVRGKLDAKVAKDAALAEAESRS